MVRWRLRARAVRGDTAGRHGRAVIVRWVAGVLALALPGLPASSAVVTATHTSAFGFVEHDRGLGEAFEFLVKELNESLDRSKSPLDLESKPRRLADVDAWSLDRQGVGVAYLPPAVFAAAHERGLPYEPVASPRMKGGPSPDGYEWTVLLDPQAVDVRTLRAKAISVRPRCSWIPFSASGHVYPFHAMLNQGRFGYGHPLPTEFEPVRVFRESDALDGLFGVKKGDEDEERSVDVALLGDTSLRRYLEDPEAGPTRLDAARRWYAQVTGESPPENCEDLLSAIDRRCRWTANTTPIPHGFLVCLKDDAPGTPSDLRRAIGDVIERTNAAFQNERVVELLGVPRGANGLFPREAQDELRELLRKRPVSRTYLRELYRLGCRGFRVPPPSDSLQDLKTKWAELSRPGGMRLVAREGEFLSAEEVVRDIELDIASRKSLAGQGRASRVALVLSGGGASGAYQAGALEAFARAIHQHNASSEIPRGHKAVEVSIVSGTSVGALNAAVAVASDLLSNPPADGETRLARLWNTVDGSDVLSTLRTPRSWDLELQAQRWLVPGFKFLLLIPLALIAIPVLYALLRAGVIASLLDPGWRMALIGCCIAVALGFAWFSGTNAAFALLGGAVSWSLLAARGASGVRVARAGPARLLERTLSASESWVDRRLGWSWPQLAVGGAMLGETARLALSRDAATEPPSYLPTLVVGGLCVALGFLERRSAPVWREGVVARVRGYPGRPRNLLGLCAVVAAILVFAVAPFWIVDVLFCRKAVFLDRNLRETLESTLADCARDRDPAGASAGTGIGDPARFPKRDIQLVITATDLMDAGGGSIRPREVRFRWGTQDLPPSNYPEGPLWVAVERNREHFVDMLLASAAIFPGLPPIQFEALGDFSASPRSRRQDPGFRGSKDETRVSRVPLFLIDGGYLSNVPVRAAVALGATHVVELRLDARPKGPAEPRGAQSTAKTLRQVMDMMIERAQAEGFEASPGVRVYRLHPTERWVKTMDFWGGRRADGTRMSLESFRRMGENEANRSVPGAEVGFRVEAP